MGRRRKRVIRLPRKSLPRVFLCPKCGENAVRVNMGGKDMPATVACGRCGLKAEIQLSPQDQAIDIYCKFTDRFYSKELVWRL